MKKEVLIKINSTQEYEDCEKDTISLITKGIFYKKNNKYYIKYDESQVLEDTKTTLKIDNDRITLIRSGASESHMIFKEGEHNIGLYQTVAGPYTLGIKTKEIINDISENGGSLKLKYDVELNYQVSGHNIFEMIIEGEV